MRREKASAGGPALSFFLHSATFLLLFTAALQKPILCNLVYAIQFRSRQQLSWPFFMIFKKACRLSVFAYFTGFFVKIAIFQICQNRPVKTIALLLFCYLDFFRNHLMLTKTFTAFSRVSPSSRRTYSNKVSWQSHALSRKQNIYIRKTQAAG